MAPVLGEPILPTSIIPSRDRPPSCPPMPLIARTVAPGAAASSWLADEVSRSKGGDALQPVTVLTTGYAVGLHVRRNLSVAGLINVRCTTLAA